MVDDTNASKVHWISGYSRRSVVEDQRGTDLCSLQDEECYYEPPPLTAARFWLVTVFGSVISLVSVIENLMLFFLFVTRYEGNRILVGGSRCCISLFPHTGEGTLIYITESRPGQGENKLEKGVKFRVVVTRGPKGGGHSCPRHWLIHGCARSLTWVSRQSWTAMG